MLIHIPPQAFKYHQDLVHGFQCARKRIFLDRMRWDVQINGDREVDEFDSAYSHYLVSVNQGEVIGGVRLTPSQVPNLTYNTFSKYFGSIPIERNPYLLESSRFGLDTIPNRTSNVLNSQTFELLIGMIKFALNYGYEKIITVVDTRMERTLRLAGWPIERITKIIQIGDTKTTIGLLPVSYHLIRVLQAKLID